jgi:DNA helicase TIP49 (TBP-interacting protein)
MFFENLGHNTHLHAFGVTVDERLEIIDGVVYDMSPAPAQAPVRKHQEVSGELFFQIKSYLKGKLCEIYSAPLMLYSVIKIKKIMK